MGKLLVSCHKGGEMEVIRVGVILKDRDHMYALIRGLSHESRSMEFIAMNHSDIKALSSAGKRDERRPGGLDVILYDDDSIYRSGIKTGIKTPVFIYLTRNEYLDTLSDKHEGEIYIYEDAAVFVNRIFEIFSEKTGRSMEHHARRKYKIVSLISSVGCAGTTSLAITAGRLLSSYYGKKVFYLSLSPFDGIWKYIGKETKSCLVSLIYHLSTSGRVNIGAYSESFEGVDHLRNSTLNRAASEMSIREYNMLLDSFDEAGVYDYIFIDIGDHIGSLQEHVISHSDLSIYVRPQGRSASADIERSSLMSKGPVKLTVNDFMSGSSGPVDPEELGVSYDPKSFIRDGDAIRIDVRGRYGNDIMNVAEKVIGCVNG